MTAALLTATIGVIVAATAWRMMSRAEFGVIGAPTAAQRTQHRWIQAGAALASAGLVAGLILSGTGAEPGEFRIESSILALLLPGFFLFLAVAGLIGTLVSGLALGGYMAAKKVGAKRLEAAAANWAEAHAAREPRVAVAGFTAVMLLALLAIGLVTDRSVHSSKDGLVVDGIFSIEGESIPWSSIEHLTVSRAPDRTTDAPSPWVLRWHRAGSDDVVIHPDDLWAVDTPTLQRVIAHHQAAGIEIRR